MNAWFNGCDSWRLDNQASDVLTIGGVVCDSFMWFGSTTSQLLFAKPFPRYAV
jgi:hypothetical protein